MLVVPAAVPAAVPVVPRAAVAGGAVEAEKAVERAEEKALQVVSFPFAIDAALKAISAGTATLTRAR